MIRDRNWHDQYARIAASGVAQDTGRVLGGSLFVAWGARARLKMRSSTPSIRWHARRFGAQAGAALADDGCARGVRRHAAVRYQHGLHFRGDEKKKKKNADGVLLFGISTAFIFTVMQFYYQHLVFRAPPDGSTKAE